MSKTAFLFVLLMPACALAHPGDLLLEITNPDGRNLLGASLFGASLAARGNWLLVGAPGGNLGINTGSVHLFNVVTGERLLTIRNPESSSAAPAHFGAAVAFHGHNILVGSPAGGLGSSAGPTYLFDFNTGEELFSFSPTSRQFGSVLASNDHDIFVGAPDDFSGVGAVYAYDGTTGTQHKILRNPLSNPISNFGSALTTIDDKIFVGAPTDNGHVFVFLNSEPYSLSGTIPDPDPASDRHFGTGLATVGHNILISSPPTSFSAGGAVYLYNNSRGQLQDPVIDSDPGFGMAFGEDITAVKDTFLVTAPGHLFGGGDAYLFDGETGDFILALPNTISFGGSVTGLGDNIVIATPSLALGKLQTVRIYEGGYHNPEPATLVLLLTGTICLAFWYIRHRHR